MKTKLICVFALMSALTAAAADLAVLTETETKLEHLALQGQGEPMKPLLSELDATLAASPKDPALLYFRAFAHYAEASVARGHRDQEQTEAHMTASLKLLNEIEDEAWKAEALALKGYLCNQIIGVKGMATAVYWSPKSMNALSKAKALAPNNPRVLFFNGVSLVTTPEMFGGDLATGVDLLAKSVAEYDREATQAKAHWGKAEALAWLGIGRQKQGDIDGAKKAWEQALAVEPQYGWVKYVLLPGLNKPEADAKK
jgi:tetratricopeptide (TPR) repeat protein